MTRVIKTGLVLAVASLGACKTMDQPTESFGAAIRHNIAVQTVAPTTEQKQNTYIRPDPQRMAAARERYKNGEVEQPEDLSTID